MNKELNIGDYVRTKDGIILKIKDTEDIYTTDNIYIGMAIYDDDGHFINDVEIIKSSPDIIDLIEVGDYVNGYKVSFIDEDVDTFVQCDYPVQEGSTNHYRFYSKAIYSIVTKEQFSSMEYKI